jgi:hypothetical protein
VKNFGTDAGAPMHRFDDRRFSCGWYRLYWLATAVSVAVFSQPAKAVDEIQVYNANIAAPGQFTIQQHLNYVGQGLKDPPFPGGLVSNGSLNGTPEFAYGVTDWWEVGLYLPFAIQNQQFYSDSFKLRTLFVSPHAEQRSFFYGVNFELSNSTPKFSQTRFGLEIRRSLASAMRITNSSSTPSSTLDSENMARRTSRRRHALRANLTRIFSSASNIMPTSGKSGTSGNCPINSIRCSP